MTQSQTPSRLLTLRTLGIGTLIAGFAAALTLGTSEAVGQVVIQGAIQGKAVADPKAKDAKKAASVEVMTFPSDRDAKNMIQAVKDYIKEYETKPEKAPWDRVCQAAQQVLDAKSDSFFETPKSDKESSQGRVSAKAEINRLIGTLPPAGRQFYQLNYGPQAENLLAQAKDAGYDRGLLAEISQRYFHTKAGAQATLLLAGVQLDRGNYIEAAYSFERLLTRPDSDDLWTPGILIKTIVALKRAGSANTTLIASLTEKLEKKFPRDGLTIGRKQYSLDELKAELDKPAVSLFGSVSEAFVSMRYGNAAHTALGDGGKPFLDPTWAISMFQRKAGQQDGYTWVSQNLEEVLRTINPAKQEVILPGFFPTTTQNLALYRTYDGLYAAITKDGFNNHGHPSLAGDIYWYNASIGGAASLINGNLEGYKKEDIENNWRYYRDQTNPNLKAILYENPLVGSLSHDGQLAYYIDDAALPPPPPNPNNEFGMVAVAPAAAGAGGPTTTVKSHSLVSGNLLRAVDISNGKLMWQLGVPFGVTMTEEEEDKSTNTLLLLQNSYFLGPPLPLNGKLYILYERNGVIRLACVEPGKMQQHKVKSSMPPADDPHGTPIATEKAYSYPSLVWIQRLGEPNVRLPADTFRRFQCSYLAYADGVMICPTNAGAVVAVDIMSRSLLWARSYRTLKTANATDENGNRIGRGRIFVNGQPAAGGQSVLRADRWRAAAPLISQGRVVFAAFDSEDLYCLDLRTGDIVWKEKQKPGDLYVGGLVKDNVLVVNKETIRAVKLFGTAKKEVKDATDGKEDVAHAWKEIKIGVPAGHGTASKDGVYYLPVAESAEDKQPQVWAIDAVKGEVQAKAAYRRKDAGVIKPMLGNLVFHEGQLYSQSATELTAFPLIELKKQEMNRLLTANPKDPVGLVARGEMLLDEGKLTEAIVDFSDAAKQSPPEAARLRLREKLFAAYTELLKKDFAGGEKYLEDYKSLCNVATDAEDPNVKLRQVEERVRRQRQYLELLARGREAQGRLAEAFDSYREYAGYGGAKELVSISDEPNGKVRPDVWARGRIEAMIRNAKDPAVKKPLEERVMKEWDTVKAGKDLVKLRDFVSVFGQHFDIGQDAQLLLGETLLASASDEDSREAQGVLSRLIATSDDPVIAARATEDLAKLYVKRGQPDTAVGLYASLGSTYATVVVRDGLTGADLLNDLLTDKRLLPFLEPARLLTPNRIKAVKENTQNQNYVPPSYVIEPDGAEGESFYRRHRITLSNNDNNGLWALRVNDRGTGEEKWKLAGLQMYNPNGGIGYRIAQARGNLLLLHLGLNVICIDVAEKKRLWEYPVFGEGNRIDFNNLQVTVGNDEELIINNADGTKFTLGRSTVLEANYAAIVTRDGLVALDPVTKSKLWTKTNISPSSIIFGDAKHVFVVETAGGKNASKVLRAVDGSTVEGVPDFAALTTGTGRVRVVGRNLLLTEGGRLKPMTLRLYDPLTGKDLWKKEYEPVPEPEDYKSRGLEFNGQAKLIRTFTGDITGAFRRDGSFEVLNVRTGAVLFKGQIDKANAELHAGMAGQPTLLADADRYYLILNKTADPNGRNNYNYGNNTLRSMLVNGPLYCFEKATGKRAWYTDKLFENQQLIIERFAEIPALVSATHTAEDDPNDAGGAVAKNINRNNGNNTMVYRVAVVDKVNGRLRMLNNMNQNGNFYGVTTDPRTATARLLRGDLNVEIRPDDDDGKTASGSGPGGSARTEGTGAQPVPTTPNPK
ncbi:hypothetical protein BH11PLA2_BH11PLA2_02990 [soil metagenome]